MGAILGQLLTALGGEAFKQLWGKLTEWWSTEGKLLFVGWYQKRAGKQEQRTADQAAQLQQEASEVTRANQRVQDIDAESQKRRASGQPPLYTVRRKP